VVRIPVVIVVSQLGTQTLGPTTIGLLPSTAISAPGAWTSTLAMGASPKRPPPNMSAASEGNRGCDSDDDDDDDDDQ